MTARRRRRAHEWVVIRIIPWCVCRYCGLICLRNDATRRAVLSWCSTEIALQDEGAAEASDMIGGWQEALTERAEAAARARALAEAVSGG